MRDGTCCRALSRRDAYAVIVDDAAMLRIRVYAMFITPLRC